MSYSVQSQAMDQVVALLNTAGAAMVPAVVAYRCRVEAFDTTEPQAWNVVPEDGENDMANAYSGATAHRFRFCVRCTVASNNEADKAADPLYVAAMKALLADPTLGGTVNFTRYLSQKWERDGAAANDNIALCVTFETEFATARNDPSVAAA